MKIFPPSIGQIEESIYAWAQHRTGVSILRSNQDPLEIVLIFAEQNLVFGEEPLRRNVFKEEWDPQTLEVIEAGQEVTIRLHPLGK